MSNIILNQFLIFLTNVFKKLYFSTVAPTTIPSRLLISGSPIRRNPYGKDSEKKSTTMSNQNLNSKIFMMYSLTTPSPNIYKLQTLYNHGHDKVAYNQSHWECDTETIT